MERQETAADAGRQSERHRSQTPVGYARVSTEDQGTDPLRDETLGSAFSDCHERPGVHYGFNPCRYPSACRCVRR